MNLLQVLKKVTLPQAIVIAAFLGFIAFFTKGDIASVEGVAKMALGLVGSVFLAITSSKGGDDGKPPSGDAPVTAGLP